MEVTTVDGKKVEIPMSEAHRVHQAMNGHTGKAEAVPLPYIEPKKSSGYPWGLTSEKYAVLTHQMMVDAQNELREATKDYPENLEEIFDFAAKHELFGDREDTHIMVNFLKVFYCLLQKETHDVQHE